MAPKVSFLIYSCVRYAVEFWLNGKFRNLELGLKDFSFLGYDICECLNALKDYAQRDWGNNLVIGYVLWMFKCIERLCSMGLR